MKTFDEIEKNNGALDLLQVAEEFGILQPKGKVLPGRFHALKIASPIPSLEESQVNAIADGKPYYDLMPVGLTLFHENWNSSGVVLMLNLRVMPPATSAYLLESYYRGFASKFGLENLFNNGKLLSLEERESFFANQAFYFTPAFFERLGKNVNFVINKYRIDQIVENRLIDWDNFGMLVKPKISRRAIFPESLDLIELFEKVNEKFLNT